MPARRKPRRRTSEDQPTVLKQIPALPSSLEELVSPRIRIVGIVATIGFLLYLIIDIASAGVAGPPSPEDIILNSLGALLSLTLFFIAWLRRIPRGLLKDLALIYQVLIAFLISTAEAISKHQNGDPIWGISWVCLLVVLFPVLIPHRKLAAVVAGLVSAGSGPVAYLIATPLQGKVISLHDIVNFYSPNVIAFLLSLSVILFMDKLRGHFADVRALGSYRLVRQIGEGAMGQVWEAEHAMLARPAAIKLIKSASLSDRPRGDQLLKRFLREAQATAAMTSSHTVTLYDYGATSAGEPYYVMELLWGIDLERLVSRYGPMPQERVIHVLDQICASLSEAHDAGLIHRDVKAANVFLCRQGGEPDFVKVLDFGLVKPLDNPVTELTSVAVVAGTPAYMAPEILQLRRYSPQSDIYALGCLAYWMLSGQHVFTGRTMDQLIAAHLNETPAPPTAEDESPDRDLVDLILDCLSKDPAIRPATCAEIRSRLASIPLPNPWTRERAGAWWNSYLPREDPGTQFSPDPRLDGNMETAPL